MFNDNLTQFSDMVNPQIDSFWKGEEKGKEKGKEYEFKKECISAVRDSKNLTDEQKDILKKVVLSSEEKMSTSQMDLDLRKLGSIREKIKIIFFRRGETFKSKHCSEKIIEEFNKEVGKRITHVESENQRIFKSWAKRLIYELDTKLCTFNGDLNSRLQEIIRLQKEIELKGSCKEMLAERKKDIDQLLDMQEG